MLGLAGSRKPRRSDHECEIRFSRGLRPKRGQGTSTTVGLWPSKDFLCDFHIGSCRGASEHTFENTAKMYPRAHLVRPFPQWMPDSAWSTLQKADPLQQSKTNYIPTFQPQCGVPGRICGFRENPRQSGFFCGKNQGKHSMSKVITTAWLMARSSFP